ncbi:hypothetical protein RSK20926_06822 [Roseobacter sp. SK209-2-6]|uniref:hypothetical protein n=1 Tax=Roseobacter sp. SK209-2-6 TaxID=388739 RepID=UPI0000F3D7D6|nr:hypothetical protein [Roseobacter sp. SK209-2-6]EBA17429.1 hypothetical protein RSK20926_06822 [Roseobacter sp. SK209-2-6]
MSASSHMKETAEDLAVKEKAWVWNKRELMSYVTQYAEAAIPGKVSKPNKKQKAIAQDAGKAKFPVTLVRKLGNLQRRINGEEDEVQRGYLSTEFQTHLRAYADGLGLLQVFS